MVREGGVRELDRLGNNAADEAADWGRWRVVFWLLMLGVTLLGSAGGGIRWFWSCIVFSLLFLCAVFVCCG